MFRDNVVVACWRLSDLGVGDIRMRKCIVDVQPFVLRNGRCRYSNYLREFIHFYVAA